VVFKVVSLTSLDVTYLTCVLKAVFLARLAAMHSGAMNSDVLIEFTSTVVVDGHLEHTNQMLMVVMKWFLVVLDSLELTITPILAGQRLECHIQVDSSTTKVVTLCLIIEVMLVTKSVPTVMELLLGHTAQTVMAVLVSLASVLLLQLPAPIAAATDGAVKVDSLRSHTVPAG